MTDALWRSTTGIVAGHPVMSEILLIVLSVAYAGWLFLANRGRGAELRASLTILASVALLAFLLLAPANRWIFKDIVGGRVSGLLPYLSLVVLPLVLSIIVYYTSRRPIAYSARSKLTRATTFAVLYWVYVRTLTIGLTFVKVPE